MRTILILGTELDMKTYNTDSRRALSIFLREHADKQFTADELARELAGKVGKSTVYRLLSRLCDEGEIRQLSNGENRAAAYQAIPDDTCLSHLHIKCTECGMLIHLDESESRRIASIAFQRSFRIDTKLTMIYGLCESCERAAR